MPPASDVPRVPAPWTLGGDAYVVMLRLPPRLIEEGSFVPEPLRGRAQGRTGALMFVDYATSDVGPYRELLFIPCRFRIGGGLFWSITKIYVSSWDSVVNGRQNWGIPKDRADFEVTREAGRERVRLHDGDHVFADLVFAPRGLRLPASSVLMPEALRTLVQVDDDRAFYYAPEASCKVELARLVEARVDPARFPDVSQGKVLFAARLSDFTLRFPIARVEPV
ncbi:acetoacetate decarboxylase family protein [Polyangium jinanense]|uniref:acetoacetate decarboxylase family protein n=1 Tax=Polyangium jinanense TaxID=2829994 RepID=UPI0023406D3B|nr:acetoacetate decarboxylase family protein [Polyangium jinanense]MDC3960441.1 acetoacetate decarboxylase family protein [Polyangium jinanense]